MQTNGQEQPQQEPQHIHSPAWQSGHVPNLPADSAVNAPLDTYLDTICAQMPAEVPMQAVQDMRLEMQGHLQAAIVAFAEMGHTPEEGLEHALTQFGTPQVVARRWRQEWEQTLAQTTVAPLWPSLKLALKTWAMADVAMIALVVVNAVTMYSRTQSPLPSVFAGLFAIPVIVGMVIGLRAKRRPLVCTLAGFALLIPILVVGITTVNIWSYYYSALITHHAHPMLVQLSWTREIINGLTGALSFTPLWIILSLLTSSTMVIGRNLNKRRQIAR